MRVTLIQNAVQAALNLDEQLRLLLASYSFFTERYPASSISDEFVLKDLNVSIKAVKQFPRSIVNQLESWQSNSDTSLSERGFEMFVLNEYNLHMYSIAYFMKVHGIELDPFNTQVVGDAFNTLRSVNRQIKTAPQVD